MPRGRCPKYSRSAWFCPLSTQWIHSRCPSSDPGSLLHPTGPVSFRDCDPEVVNILRCFWSPNSSAVASCPQGLHRTVRSRERSCRVPGSGRSCLQEGWTLPETRQDLERSLTSRLAGGTRSKHNVASVQGSLGYFCMCGWCKKCFFCFAFKKNPPTHDETQNKGHGRHAGKGVIGKGKTRQQMKICHLLLMLEEFFGPVAAVCALLLPAWQPSPLLCKKGVKMTHRSDEVKALVTC